ncbi:MAG: hypothetical protein GY754_07490 [bacterium]|nr:hypothetical protein [bacterium]
MMKKLFSGLIFILISIFSLSNCGKSYILNNMKKFPAANRVYIHPNPVKGDFAVHEDQDGVTAMKFEITDVRKSLVTFRITFEKASVSALKSIAYYYTANRSGWVQKAWLRDLETKVDYPLKIAVKGDQSFIYNYTRTSYGKKESFTTRAGTFPVKEVITYNQSYKGGILGTFDHTTVELINPAVKFGLLKRIQTRKEDLPIQKVLDILSHILGGRSQQRQQVSVLDLILDGGVKQPRKNEMKPLVLHTVLVRAN